MLESMEALEEVHAVTAPRRSRSVGMLIGLAVAVVCGWLTLRKVDFAAAVAAMQSAQWKLFGLIPLALGVTVLVRALRWRLLLPDHAERRWGVLYRVAGIGVAANAMLPGKLGEIVAAHAAGRLCDISRMQAIGMVLIGRAIDLVVLAVLVSAGALVLPEVVPEAIRETALVVLAAFGAGLLLLAVSPRGIRETGVQFLARRVTSAIGAGAGSLVVKFARGLGSITGVRHLLLLLGCTLLLWVTLALALWIATCAFGLGLSIAAAPLLLGITTVGAIVPSAPGNVGTYHFFGVLALGLFGVGRDPAVACIIAYHAADVLSCVLIGTLSGVWAGSSFWVLKGGVKSATAPMAK